MKMIRMSLTPIMSIEQLLIEEGRLPSPPHDSQRPLYFPHGYFMSFLHNYQEQSTGDQDSSSSYKKQSEYGHRYDSVAQYYEEYLFNQYRRNDDDDIEPGRHST